MKHTLLLVFILTIGSALSAQNKDKGKLIEVPKKGFYDDVILKDVQQVKDSLNPKAPKMKFIADMSEMDLPNKIELYKRQWANPPVSQGNTGTCWDFSTISLYESEIFRQCGKKVKLSETYMVYWEYVEKARRFIQERGNSTFEEGSESNALTRLADVYGLMPESEYGGLLNGHKYHTHADMFNEMDTYLKSVKQNNAWNETEIIATIRDIMKHYMGEPPLKFTVDGKEYTPVSYMEKYLKFNPNDFVQIISYLQKPYWEKVEYEVEDNWWHNKDYCNVPLDDFIQAIKKAIRKGYTIGIGGDVSEAGFSRDKQCAIIPDFDIPSAWINEDARQFRFSNKTTTDDHGLHLVGYLENYKGDGKDWFLIKDSGSGSRNNDINAPEFGYYFFSEDYIKLKIMDFTVNKEAVTDLLSHFK
jgi:bleomycin hydrolase